VPATSAADLPATVASLTAGVGAPEPAGEGWVDA
jgi:hypothetical protein